MPPATRRRPLRFLWRIGRVLLLAYLGLGLTAYFAQDYLMYPAQRPKGSPPKPFKLGAAAQVLDLTTADGTPIAAAFAVAAAPDGSPLPDAAQRPSILYFYGNGGTVQWSDYEFDHFRRLGANVLIPDLPGFGASGGRMSESAGYATADAAYAALCRRADPTKIIVVGWSLGGAMAVDLANRKPVAALATFNAFTTMPDEAQTLLPYLPTRYLCRAQYDNEAKIRTVRCPTLICNGDRDIQIPPAMSDRLAAAAGGPVTRLHVATADHNSIFDAEPQTVWPALQRVVDAVSKR